MNKKQIKVGELKIKYDSVWPTSHSHVQIVFQLLMTVVVFPALEVRKCPQTLRSDPDHWIFARWRKKTNKKKVFSFCCSSEKSHADLPGGLCVCILFPRNTPTPETDSQTTPSL